MYFPEQFSTEKRTKVAASNELIQKMRLEVLQIIEGDSDDRKNRIEQHEKSLLYMDKPNVWNIHHKGNMEVEMETEFAKFMYAVGEHTNEDMEVITTFGFYALVGYLKEKNKPVKNGNS